VPGALQEETVHSALSACSLDDLLTMHLHIQARVAVQGTTHQTVFLHTSRSAGTVPELQERGQVLLLALGCGAEAQQDLMDIATMAQIQYNGMHDSPDCWLEIVEFDIDTEDSVKDAEATAKKIDGIMKKYM
jgi:hypothetical protein